MDMGGGGYSFFFYIGVDGLLFSSVRNEFNSFDQIQPRSEQYICTVRVRKNIKKSLRNSHMSREQRSSIIPDRGN